MPGPWELDDKLIVDDTGAPLECPDCPCDAPTSCPCTEWPAFSYDPETAFPCGGLVHQYRIKSYDVSTTSWDGGDCGAGSSGNVVQYRLKSGGKDLLTAVGGSPSCTWEGLIDVEYSSDGGLNWNDNLDENVSLSLDGTLPAWELIGLEGLTGDRRFKEDGRTPEGFWDLDGCDHETMDNYIEYVGSMEVEEVTP